MATARSCSECGTLLTGAGPRQVTCSDKCRATRSRRVRRAQKREADYEQSAPEAYKEIRAEVRREGPIVIQKALGEELRPIIREAITEDTLRAISEMVGLAPRAIELIGQDMESEDPVIRQRAYTLLMRYTAGHTALVTPQDTEAGKQITVNFALPRPDAPEIEADIEEVQEVRQCDMCGEEKTASEFVTNSTRCQDCFREWKETVTANFAAT